MIHLNSGSPRSASEAPLRHLAHAEEVPDKAIISVFSTYTVSRFTDLTIPHLLAYLLSIRYERHRNVHMGFALLKLRFWIELLAFEASEHCYAVARLALRLDRLDRSGTSTTDVSYGVWARRRLDSQRATTCLKYEFCQYTHIPMFTF